MGIYIEKPAQTKKDLFAKWEKKMLVKMPICCVVIANMGWPEFRRQNFELIKY
jgi:hypothetical protein